VSGLGAAHGLGRVAGNGRQVWHAAQTRGAVNGGGADRVGPFVPCTLRCGLRPHQKLIQQIAMHACMHAVCPAIVLLTMPWLTTESLLSCLVHTPGVVLPNTSAPSVCCLLHVILFYTSLRHAALVGVKQEALEAQQEARRRRAGLRPWGTAWEVGSELAALAKAALYPALLPARHRSNGHACEAGEARGTTEPWSKCSAAKWEAPCIHARS